MLIGLLVIHDSMYFLDYWSGCSLVWMIHCDDGRECVLWWACLDNGVLFVHVRFLVLNYVHTEEQSPQQCH